MESSVEDAGKPCSAHTGSGGEGIDRQVVIEVDWSMGHAAPHVATLLAESAPLAWQLQAALEITTCVRCTYLLYCHPGQCVVKALRTCTPRSILVSPSTAWG